VADPDDLERVLAAGAPAGELTEDLVRGRLRASLFGEDAVPVRLGRYTLLERLGAGGMGTVYAAWDAKLDRKVALKLLRPDAARDAARARARLLREAQALARLSHPNVVAVFDVATWAAADDPDRTHVLLAMELVPGTTLGGWLGAASRHWREILRMFAQAGRGLAAAHAAGIVHRDFKPANVIVGDDGRARVVDFGLADVRTADSEPSAPTQASSASSGRLDDDDHASREVAVAHSTIAIAGTPRYMAPEQHEGRAIDPRSDQYAFCVSLWEALHGEPPWRAATMPELYAAKLAFGERVAADSRAPAWVRRTLVRGLQPEPAARHPSMDALLAELDRDPARRLGRVALGLVVVGSVGTAVALAVRSPSAACEEGASRIAGVWDGTRADEIAGAFAATSVPYAETTWQSARHELDEWASEWIDAHRHACESHRRGEASDELLDLRMTCLEHRRERLRALVDVLASADAGTVERAVNAVQRLPGVARCADATALRQQTPPPEDPEEAAVVRALERRLADAEAALDAGRHAAALELADGVLADYERGGIDYRIVLADARQLRGDALSWLGRSTEARDELEAAAIVAQEGGSDLRFATACAALVWEVGELLGEHAAAEDWAALGRAAVTRAGGDPEAERLLLNNLGAMRTTQGEFAEARELLEDARALVERTWGAEDHRAFVAEVNLANVELQIGEHTAAAERYERAVAMGTALLGDTHPRVLIARGNLVSALSEGGQRTRALTEAREIVEIQESSLAPGDPQLAFSLQTLASLETNQSRHADARAHAERALAIFDASQAGEQFAMLPLVVLGRSQLGLGDVAQARRSFERALAIGERVHGPDHFEVAAVRVELGQLELDEGRLDAAETQWLAARRILAPFAGLGRERGLTALYLADLADVRDQHALAVAWGSVAFAETIAAGGAMAPQSGRVALVMGRIALGLEMPELAIEWLARAQTVVDANDPGPTGTDVALAWADAEWALGRAGAARERIRAQLERALDEAERARMDAWSRAHE
jgi:eukaryotic-like serine/threonine-protein kinase